MIFLEVDSERSWFHCAQRRSEERRETQNILTISIILSGSNTRSRRATRYFYYNGKENGNSQSNQELQSLGIEIIEQSQVSPIRSLDNRRHRREYVS